MVVSSHVKTGAAIAVLALAAGCGGKASSATYSAAMEKVNGLFAQAMAEDRAAAESATNSTAAFNAYRHAAETLAEAAKTMSDLPPPDAETARSVGWTSASDTMKTQRNHLEKAIRQSCGT